MGTRLLKVQDAWQWLEARRPTFAVEGPRRAAPIIERLEFGDVLDDGDVLTTTGAICVSHPGIWMTVPQAHRAAYFGWERVDDRVAREPRTCRVVILMGRERDWPTG